MGEEYYQLKIRVTHKGMLSIQKLVGNLSVMSYRAKIKAFRHRVNKGKNMQPLNTCRFYAFILLCGFH